MLNKKLIASAVFGLAFVATSATAALDFGTTTLKLGSKGEAVKTLQTLVGATPVDGIFGKGTCAKVKAWQANNGLTADCKFGPASKAKANGTSTTTTTTTTTTTPATTTLAGGAGSIDLTPTSTDVESTVNEGDTDTKVLGFKVEADGSDVVVSNLKVTFKNIGSGSYRLDRYAKEVSVWMGSTKVGSASVSDFNKSGTEYSKSISLSNAVVKEGTSSKGTFYITVSANSNIDSTDMNADSWAMKVTDVRYTDATGVILTSGETMGSSTLNSKQFDFVSLALSGDVKVTVSKGSSNPVAQNVKVSDTSSTKDVQMLEFKVKTTDSPVSFDVLNITTAVSGGTTAITSVIGELQLKNGSNTLATIDGSDLDGTESFDLDDTFTIAKNTTETFRIYATVEDYDNFKTNGGSVKVSFASFSPEDSNGDIVNDTGSANGEYQTFVLNTPIYKLVSKSLALNQSIDGVEAGQEDIFLAKFTFNVTAGDDDIYLPKAITTTAGADAANLSFATFTHTGAGAVTGAVVEADNSSIDDGQTSSYLISSGSTEKFTVSYYVRGNNSADKFTISGFKYGLADDTAAPYEYTSGVTTGLSDFETSSVYLAK